MHTRKDDQERDWELQLAIETAKRMIARHRAAGEPLNHRFERFKQSTEELEQAMRVSGRWRE
jgi:hypothetical protein